MSCLNPTPVVVVLVLVLVMQQIRTVGDERVRLTQNSQLLGTPAYLGCTAGPETNVRVALWFCAADPESHTKPTSSTKPHTSMGERGRIGGVRGW